MNFQTVPRVLNLDYEGKQLIQWPIEEIESLRGNKIQLQDIELRSGDLVEVERLQVSQASTYLNNNNYHSFYFN